MACGELVDRQTLLDVAGRELGARRGPDASAPVLQRDLLASRPHRDAGLDQHPPHLALVKPQPGPNGRVGLTGEVPTTHLVDDGQLVVAHVGSRRHGGGGGMISATELAP